MKLLFRIIVFLFLFNSVNCYSQSTSSIRKDGTVMLNDKPFFPIGIYVVSWKLSADVKLAYLKDIANSGFNMIHIGGDTSPEFKNFMDQAQALGVYVMVEGINFSAPNEFVNMYKSHPALLGWNVADDAHDHNTVAQLQAKHDTMKALDPNHITYCAMYNFNNWTLYHNIVDAVGPYVYPMPENRPYLNITTKIFNVNKYSAIAKAIITPFHSQWGIPQAMDFPSDKNLAPSPIEYRNMVYQYLINNAKAIMPYTYFDQFNFLPKDHPVLYAEMKILNEELNTLKEVLMNGINTKHDTGCNLNEYGIWVNTWVYENQTYIVAINTDSKASRSLNIFLPILAKAKLQSVFTNRPKGLSFSNKTKMLSGDMQPLDVHVYKIATSTCKKKKV